MTHPNILIPFSLPPAEHAKDLVQLLTEKCGTDGLATLLSRHSSRTIERFEDFSPQLPHEKFLQEWLSKQGQSFLSHCANTLNVNLPAGYWFILHPAHLHIARNHLVLTDYRQLALPESEALTLFEKAQALCADVGLELIYGSASTWFVRADTWSDLITSTPDAACGHNIDIWLPKGKSALAWRKLQNEIQMEWFIQPLQEQRTLRGDKVINGLWLWGGVALTTNIKASAIMSPTTFNEFTFDSSQLILLDQLRSAALTSDWGTWANAMIELETTWFLPLCAALKHRSIQLHLSNSNTLLSIHTGGSALKKFWRTPTFKNLLT